jgi:hypothetical protein
MSELVKVGRTMKVTFEQISEQGFLDQFPGSEFRNESSFSGIGDVYIQSNLVEDFNQLKQQTIETNGSFPILD